MSERLGSEGALIEPVEEAPETQERGQASEEAIVSDQVANNSELESNEGKADLHQKANESFWLEQHGLLKPPILNRIRESSATYVRTGSRRLLTALGAMSVLASATWLSKDAIVENIDTIMKAPAVVSTIDEYWQRSHQVDKDQMIPDDEISLIDNNRSEKWEEAVRTLDLQNELYNESGRLYGTKRERDQGYYDLEKEFSRLAHEANLTPQATVRLGGATLEIRDYDSIGYSGNGDVSIDKGPHIPVTDPYLANLLSVKNRVVLPPQDPEQFSRFISEQAREKGIFGEDNLKNGEVESFVSLAVEITLANLTYDKQTAAWLDISSDSSRMKLIWGNNNPLRALISSDNVPVDQLLTDKKTGVCRHYSETFNYVVEELKRQHPDKFQNIYSTSVPNAYQMHVYNAIYLVKDSKTAEMYVLDTTKGFGKSSPAFDLFRTLYHRNIIDKESYVGLSAEYIESESDLDWEDAEQFSSWALSDGSSEAIQATGTMLESCIKNVTDIYHNEEIFKGTRQEIWEDFQSKVMPLVDRYQRLTGHIIYRTTGNH